MRRRGFVYPVMILCAVLAIGAFLSGCHKSGGGQASGQGNSAPSREAPKPNGDLTAEFALVSPGDIEEQETSTVPGGGIDFIFKVKNTGTNPVECPKVAIEPASQLELDDEGGLDQVWGESGPLILKLRQDTMKNLSSGVPMQVSHAATFDSMGGKLNPADNKYYLTRTDALWIASHAIGEVKGCPQVMGFGNYLRLSRKATPGTDIVFTGYIVVNGEKQTVNTVTVHVQHPD